MSETRAATRAAEDGSSAAPGATAVFQMLPEEKSSEPVLLDGFVLVASEVEDEVGALPRRGLVGEGVVAGGVLGDPGWTAGSPVETGVALTDGGPVRLGAGVALAPVGEAALCFGV